MRLIDADALKTLIAENVYPVRDDFNNVDYGMFWTGGIEKAINEMPTVEERKTGKWIEKPKEEYQTFDECVCSNCGVVEYFNNGWKRFNYCPNCGAKMEH